MQPNHWLYMCVCLRACISFGCCVFFSTLNFGKRDKFLCIFSMNTQSHFLVFCSYTRDFVKRSFFLMYFAHHNLSRTECVLVSSFMLPSTIVTSTTTKKKGIYSLCFNNQFHNLMHFCSHFYIVPFNFIS